MIIFFNTVAFSVFKVHTFSSTNQNLGDVVTNPYEIKYETVQILCDPSACRLYCNAVNDEWGKECWWSNATWCDGCSDSYQNEYWNPSDANTLYDFAIEEVKNGNYNGSISNNLINGSNNITYHRLLSWNYNSTTNLLDINITISYDDGL